MKKTITVALTLVLVFAVLCVPASAAEGITALSTDISFECNAVPMDIETYNISNFGFYKLRDIAAMCDGTEKEFSVEWDEGKGMITLTAGGDYSILPSDLQPGGGATQTAYVSDAIVVVNGAEVALTAYNINGFTYYKLRELCSALDIYVSWNEEKRISGIDTSRGYEDSSAESGGEKEDEFTAEDFANAFPKTVEEYADVIRYMMTNGQLSFSISEKNVNYPKAQFDELNQKKVDTFEDAYCQIAEDSLHLNTFYSGYTAQLSWKHDQYGNVKEYTYTFNLKTNDNMGGAEAKQQISMFEQECQKVINELRAAGRLSAQMSVKEQAAVLYEYVDQRFAYDLSYSGLPVYSNVVSNRAVCEGYTAFYNYLLELIGIDAKAQFGRSNEHHVWTMFTVGGQTYYTDVTWGDPIPDQPGYSDPRYFWLSYEELLRLDPGRVFYKEMHFA